MGRDRLVDQIAEALRLVPEGEEYRRRRQADRLVELIVEPLLAEKDKAAVALAELVRLKDGPRDAAYEEAKPYAWAQARLVLSEASPVSLDEPGSVEEQEPGRLVAACSHCDGHGLMQTGYTGTLQYCGECNACDGSGTVPVVTDEERAALRSACSKCGGLVRLELRCEACGDLPAVEGAESWTEWRACWWDGLPASDWRRDREFIEGVHLLTEETKGGAFIEQRTVWASRPVRVEEQGEEA